MPDEISTHDWPTTLDLTVSVGFFTAVVAAAVFGYVFMVVDYRAYLKSLRRHLVRVVYRTGGMPDWVRRHTPRCISALGLELPCTEDEVKQAYREKVKSLHPDLGGDQKRFLQLQTYFEEALELIREG